MKLPTLLPTLVLIGVSALGVVACASESSTTHALSIEDGERNDKSWVRTWKDRARFECVASTSGACQVVVFVTECPGAACNTRILRELQLAAGQTLNVKNLPPGFRYCLSHDGRPVPPDCAG